jgi:hypothetical protein
MRAGACFEAVRRRVEPELVEEDVRELAVVVLACVEDDLVGAAAKGERERAGLDELRSISDDGKDSHVDGESSRGMYRSLLVTALDALVRGLRAKRDLEGFVARRRLA